MYNSTTAPAVAFAVILISAIAVTSEGMQIWAKNNGFGQPKEKSKLVVRTTCDPAREVVLGNTQGLAALSAMSLEDTDGDTVKETVRFTGFNVQVISGSGATDGADRLSRNYRTPRTLYRQRSNQPENLSCRGHRLALRFETPPPNGGSSARTEAGLRKQFFRSA